MNRQDKHRTSNLQSFAQHLGSTDVDSHELSLMDEIYYGKENVNVATVDHVDEDIPIEHSDDSLSTRGNRIDRSNVTRESESILLLTKHWDVDEGIEQFE